MKLIPNFKSFKIKDFSKNQYIIHCIHLLLNNKKKVKYDYISRKFNNI